MKAYPTVDDLPDDVRSRFSGDALEVYRAAYNISYAYNEDPEIAAQEAEAAARKIPAWFTNLRGFVLAFVALAAVRWILGGGNVARISEAVFWAAFMIVVYFASSRYEVGKQISLWDRREVESLDDDGNRKLNKRPRWNEPDASNGYYPTVAHLPQDVRARLTDDAQKAYRAAFNISYAYDGRDVAVAVREADKAARRAKLPLAVQIGFVLWVVGGGTYRWVSEGARLEQMPQIYIWTTLYGGFAVLFIWTVFGWRTRRLVQREAELLDADGNPTMPGAVLPVPHPAPSSGGTEPVNPSQTST